MTPVYYNCHAHIFNQKCAPKNFLTGFIAPWQASAVNWVASFELGRSLLGNLARWLPFKNWRRSAAFLSIGANLSQRDLLEGCLIPVYPDYWRFVLLTLNMEHMEAGSCEVDFKTQLDEIMLLRRDHPEYTLLPFLSVDPRMNWQKFGCSSLLEFVSTYVHPDKGFIGIKIYPNLGYFPDDPRLLPVYAWAEAQQVPVLTHCNRGGTFYRNDLTPFPDDGIDRPWANEEGADKKAGVFAHRFTAPEAYANLLTQFPRLKLCFGHLGGEEDVLSAPAAPKIEGFQKRSNWYELVKGLIANPAYPNIYGDISYTLFKKKALTKIYDDFRQQGVLDRLLFGTDFYMVAREGKENDFVKQTRDLMGLDFDVVAGSNAITFLQSSLFPQL